MAARGGRWIKGQSGDPGGRPKGPGRWASLLEQVTPELPEVVFRLLELARGGDLAAIKLILDRTWPVLKPSTPLADLTLLMSAPDLASAGQSLLASAERGDVTLDAALSAHALLLNQARLVEHTELASRVAALETRGAKP
jgi:hypothetical protein